MLRYDVTSNKNKNIFVRVWCNGQVENCSTITIYSSMKKLMLLLNRGEWDTAERSGLGWGWWWSHWFSPFGILFIIF